MFLEKRARREIIILNVIPLIDISAMIIIFLVMGAIFGDTSVVIPKDTLLPRSDNKENLVNAPQVSVSKDQVIFSLMQEAPVPLVDFHADKDTPAIKSLRGRLKEYIDKIPKEQRAQGILLNIVADEKAPYKNIFNVLRVFRESGFQSILFVAQGK